MVMSKAKNLKSKLLPKSSSSSLDPESVKVAREYIDQYWKKLERKNTKDDGSLIGLPKPYLVPASEEGHDFDFDELYYWDSYFMVQGMLNDPHRKEFVLGILEDLLSLYTRFKIIPNASRTYLMGRSQPPLLTSFILDVYAAYNMDKKWLAKSKEWDKAAKHRAKTMKELMWSDLKGMYYDYRYTKETRGNVESLAAYFTMWSGQVDDRQAARLVSSLKRFEKKGGLSTTDAQPLGKLVSGPIPAQWAYPNGWAPLHLITIRGLENYGYHEEAKRIALKWIKNNLDWFNKNGVFLEKYNVINPEKPPAKGVYPSQVGFGWTNAVFERLCQDYLDIEAVKSDSNS
jgi:neutral trehalase